MRPPAEATLREALRTGYGIEAHQLDADGEGADAAAWAWRLTANDGRRFFLKLRREVRPAAVLVPRHLRSLGFEEVVAAIPTRSGEAWLEVDGWTAVVMDLVDGDSAYQAGLPLAGWRRLGAFAARLHAVELPVELIAVVPAETFRSKWVERARELDAGLERRKPAVVDEHSLAVRQRWIAERAAIAQIVGLADDLGAQIRARPSRPPFVLCHADFHTFNILVDRAGRLHVVDWDEIVLAPPERDLMFVRGSVVANTVTDAEADAFDAGYGSSTIDRELLAWYRIDWAVQDVTGFATEVLLEADRDPPNRPRARQIFEALFEPGNEVPAALAIASDLRREPDENPAKNPQHP